MKRFVWILLAMAVILGGGTYYRKHHAAKTGIKVLEKARVEEGSVRGILVATGIIKPQVGAMVKIGARVTGTIEKMMVRVGDWVHKGELIALIDDREIKQELAIQEAALEKAKSTLEKIRKTYPQRIEAAKADYVFARVNYLREEKLLKNAYTTENDVDRARSDLKRTEAVYKRLQDEFLSEEKITRAQIKEIVAKIRRQRIRLSYTRIYAPIDGEISQVTIQEGETIVTGLQVANLVSVLDPTRLEMWIYVDETDIGRVRPGQQVNYYVDTYPDRIFHGEITRVRPQPVVKDNIVYYLAIVRVSKADARFLKPEMTSYVKIIYAEEQGVLTIPNNAVKFKGGKQIAYRIEADGRIKPVAIKVGIRGENRTEIRAGLKAGDMVATKLILPVQSMELK